MAMYLSQKWGKKVLDALLGGVALTPPAYVTAHLWTVSPDETGTGGTEVTGYSPPVVTWDAAINGTSGLVAKALNNAAATFSAVPVASTAVHAVSLHDEVGDLVWINDAWAAPTWAAGASPQVAAGQFSAGFTK